jgi:membrane fusion protein (multidrug efflux system)
MKATVASPTPMTDIQSDSASPRAIRPLLVKGAVVLAVLVAVAAGTRWWTVGRFIESTDDAYVNGDITTIAPKVSGFVAHIAVTDNQPVHAGDLLITLDSRDFTVQAARAAAAVAAAQAEYENLVATRRKQEAVVRQESASTVAATAQADRARANHARYRELATVQYASRQRLEEALADDRAAGASVDRAAASRTAAQRELDVIDTAIARAEAQLAAATADRQQADLNLSYTEIRAPVDGVVANRAAREGGYVAIGGQLMSVVPAKGLWVEANFKETQVAEMKPGQQVRFSIDTYGGRDFVGHVGSLAPASGAKFSLLPVENATGNFTKIVQRVPVRLIPDGDAAAAGVLRPGLSATVHVNTRDISGP